MKEFNTANTRLFVLSVWMLFLELFIIRWVSTEIRIFAYTGNLVLLACFIGIGLGCYSSDKAPRMLFGFAMLAILAVSVGSPLFRSIPVLLSGFQDSAVYGVTGSWTTSIPAFKGILLTVGMFAAIVCIFFPLGQLMGRMFAAHPRIIAAYSINVFGSIVGVWFFALLSFLYTPPWLWLILSMAAGFIFLENKRLSHVFFFLLLLVVSLAAMTKGLYRPSGQNVVTLWSPYQKLELKKSEFGYLVTANNTGMLFLTDMSPAYVHAHFPAMLKANALGVQAEGFGLYSLPYGFKDTVEDILIIGAGSGNEVAEALRRRIGNIDAVEIDPGIYRLSLLFHPEAPFKDPRVHAFIDDGRSFLKKTRKKYDLILVASLDSFTGSSNYNNIRQDHYVYTQESFREMKKLLKDDGVLMVWFISLREWIEMRMYGLMKTTFNAEPFVFNYKDFNNKHMRMYVAGNDMKALQEKIGRQERLSNFIKANTVDIRKPPVKLTTDDWPYIYLKGPGVPTTFLCIILSLFVVFTFAGKALFREAKRPNFHFFFLGAAFMLLEFQNVTKTALLFGSTWLVNAYTISAVLLLILAANLYARHGVFRRKPAYVLLCLSIAALYAIPLNNLNIPSYFLKVSLVVVFLNLPVFFGGLIFINSLQKASSKSIALGSNLLGASLGGLCESLSFIFGIRALLLLIILFYMLAYLSEGGRITGHEETTS
jgi:spermidine synthase